MIRCTDGAAGTFKVTFEYLDTYGEPVSEEYLADIGPHAPVYGDVDGKRQLVEDIPRASQKRPYEGELCACEVSWIKHLPGRTYSAHRRYALKEVK